MIRNSTIKLLVGTYTSDTSKGIYSIDFNAKDGTLSDQVLVAKSENPSFLTISKDRRFVFAVNETDSGAVSGFKWNTDRTQLELVSNLSSQGRHPCFISLNKKDDLVSIANYSSGNIAVYNVENGVLLEGPQVRNHEGSSVVKPNQDAPHAHCTKFSKEGHFLYVTDLGIDEVVGYPLDKKKRLGKKFTAYKMDAGDGPRHFVYHPTKDIVYIISEFSNTITVASINSETRKFTKIDKQSTLPVDFIGESFGADIHISADGKFLYASNRGHNSIAIFSVLKDGSLKLLCTEPVHGNWPRNFTLSPDEKFLLVANQKSDNITVFEIDKEIGLLTFTGVDFKISKPVCLEF